MNKIIEKLKTIKPNSTFMTLKSYTNSEGEVADYSIVFNISYKNALARSVANLKAFVPSTSEESIMKDKMLASYEKSLAKLSGTKIISDGYSRPTRDGRDMKGVKIHEKTNTLHFFGRVVHKRVITPGTKVYTNDDVRNKLNKLCPVSSFRQFKISDNVGKITVAGVRIK